MREAVLAHAHAASALAGATTSIAIGGILVSKKVLVLTAAALAALSIPLWNHFGARSEIVSGPASPELATALRAGPEPESTKEPAAAAAEPAAMSAERAEAGAAPVAASGELLRGLVIDGETKQPLADVLVELFPPERMTLRTARERGNEAIGRCGFGAIVGNDGSDPDSIRTWSTSNLLEDDELDVLGEVSAGATPRATMRTAADGRFELPFPAGGATLSCDSESYAHITLAFASLPGELAIELARPRSFAGRVVDQEGRPIGREVELLAFGRVATQPGYRDGGHFGRDIFAEVWPIRTDAAGGFAIEVPAKQVMIHLLTPGLLLSPVQQFDVGSSEPTLVRTIPAPYLRVRDGANGAPIERFSVVSRGPTGPNWWSGDQFARGGVFALIHHESTLRFHSGAHEMSVWAEGYAASTRRVDDLAATGEIAFDLEPGRVPVLTGNARDGDRPIAGARAWLRPCYASQWLARGRERGDGCRTGADGTFQLSMPAGSYVLSIDTGATVYAETLELEFDLDRSIDLARLGRVVVEIRDANGVPRTAHTIALHGDDGRRQINETDSTGRAEFAWLPDGRYRLHAPLVPTKGSFSGGVLANAEIVGGSTALVPMVLPAPSGPIRVRLVADGVGDYSGWRAVHMQREGVAVEPNGTVPIDLSASNFRHLTISSPDRRQWKVTLPRDVRDGHEIPLRLDGPCYEGVVLDRASGAPVTNLLVTAGAPGSSVDAMRVSSSTRTDERGRFRVVCSASVPHSLGFESEKTTTLGGMSRDVYEGVHFDPTAPPLPSPDPIEIRIPYLDQDRFVGVPSKHLAGVVRCAGTREVARGAQVSITVTEPVEHGTLTFWSWCMAGEDGRYEIVVPDTSTYRAHVSDAQLGRSTDTTWEGLPGSDEVRDFELP